MQTIIDSFLQPVTPDQDMAAPDLEALYRSVLSVIQSKSISNFNLAKYWDYYNNDFELYLTRNPEEDPEDFAERVRYFTKENHCRRTANLSAAFLYGQVIGRHSINEATQNLLRATWRAVKVKQFMMKVALMASVTGYATVIPHIAMVYLDGEVKKVVVWELVDSSEATLIPDSENSDVLSGLIINRDVKTLMSDNSSKVVTLYSGYDIYKWIEDKLVEHLVSPIPVDSLICLLQNPGDPMLLTGQSDLEDILSLNEHLNKTLTSMDMVADYYSDPILKLTGATLPENWHKTSNAVMELDDGADADFLTWDANMDALQTITKNIRTQIPIISGISSLSRSDLTNIGQIRTTGGIETAFKTDIETIRAKQVYAKEFDEQLHSITLELYKTMGYSIPSTVVEINFPAPERVIIRAGLEEAEAESLEVQTGRKSLADLYKEAHPDSSLEEIEKNAPNMVIPEPKKQKK